MLTLRPIRLNFSGPAQGAWAENIEGRYSSCVEPGDAVWARCFRPDGGGDLRSPAEDTGIDSDDVTSPTLWKNSPTSSADTSWEIAEYQREMLDKVRAAPESNFELSMRDLVELPAGQKTPLREKELLKAKDGGGWKQEKPTKPGRRISRTESMNHGIFLLKLYLPIPGGWRRGSSTRAASSKVTPKPIFSEGQKGGASKGGESECWGSDNSIGASPPIDQRSDEQIIEKEQRVPNGCHSFFFRKSYSFYNGRK